MLDLAACIIILLVVLVYIYWQQRREGYYRLKLVKMEIEEMKREREFIRKYNIEHLKRSLGPEKWKEFEKKNKEYKDRIK